ncbi:Kazal-type serine protease inhibitor domain protein [Minicystis rosea]|nr:Kazal-type serine protease inhibitor domain protein [Minicystis rosea]
MFKRVLSIVAFVCLGIVPMAACSLQAQDGAGDTDQATSEAQSALQTCGGIAGIQCPTGYACIDDPTDGCDPNAGGADCGGLCVPQHLQTCGGFLGLACPSGFECIDDPRDDCDPHAGGADCSGICVRPPRAVLCAIKHPGATYVSHDPEECKYVKFACPKGETMFSDACGCGCE